MSARSEALKLSERQAAELIKSGLSPNDVAMKLRMTKRPEELKRRILMQVGEGKLLLSEIYFSIPEAKRRRYQNLYESILETIGEYSGTSMGEGDAKIEFGQFMLMLKAAGVKHISDFLQSQDTQIDDEFSMIDFDLYWLSKDSPHTDTYRFLRDLEMTLHRVIRRTLDLAFPKHDDDWWSKGVPLETRKRCSAMQEEDADHHLEAYSYTNFIDFMKIIGSKSNKDKFREVLPMELADDRKMAQLLKDLERVNEIRNGVMHPIKGIPLLKDQCDFVRRLRDQLLGFRWRKPIGTQ
jgi:hypothetical protein